MFCHGAKAPSARREEGEASHPDQGSATGGCGEGQKSTHCWANTRISRSTARRGFGSNLSPGVAQSNGAVEHEPAGCRVRVGAEIALPLELHDLAGLLFDQHRLDAGLA